MATIFGMADFSSLSTAENANGSAELLSRGEQLATNIYVVSVPGLTGGNRKAVGLNWGDWRWTPSGTPSPLTPGKVVFQLITYASNPIAGIDLRLYQWPNYLYVGMFADGVTMPGGVKTPLGFSSLNCWELVFEGSELLVYRNNKLVGTYTHSAPWAATDFAFQGKANGNGTAGVLSYIVSDSRLGMAITAPATPTIDSNTGTVTGTLPAALTTFDGDTSYVTYTEGSAQSTVLNAAGLSAIPSDAVIHAVKLTASAAGAGGVAAGELTLETAAGASDVGEVEMALSYSPTTVVLNADPATSAAFIASEIAAGTVKFGVREG